MKTTTQNKTGHSFIPAQGFDATARSRAARDAGKNDNFQSLTDAGLGAFMLANYATITLSDFIKLSANFGLSFEDRASWFEAFCSEALKSKRLVEIPSCYDEKAYRVV